MYEDDAMMTERLRCTTDHALTRGCSSGGPTADVSS